MKKQCIRCGKKRGMKTCFRPDRWGVHGVAGLLEPFCVDCRTAADDQAITEKRVAAQRRGRERQLREKKKGWRTASINELIDGVKE